MTGPKINDQYWFDYSEKLVTDSISRLDSAITNVQKFTTGLLATYTASAIFTIEYKEIENIWLILLFGLPYILVLIGQWLATVSTTPKSSDFDPRIPAEIREVHNQIHYTKEQKLKVVSILSLVTTLVVSLTLMLGFTIGNKNLKEKSNLAQKLAAEKEVYMDPTIIKEEKELLITGYFPPESNLTLKVEYFLKNDTIEIPPKHFVNSKHGQFHYSFKLKELGKGAKIYCEWSDGKQNNAIIKKVNFQ